MNNQYEAARSLAVSWAINGPGTFSVLGDGFVSTMDTLLGVFKNSVPTKFRDEAKERAKNTDWLSEQEIDTLVTRAISTMAQSDELPALAANFGPQDMAFFSRAAYFAQSNPAAAWMQEVADKAHETNKSLRDAMAEAATAADAFQASIGDDVHALKGGDAEHLRAAVEDLKLSLDAARPFNGSRVSALEPALNAAQTALVRFAHDGRLIVAAEDTGDVKGLAEARALETAIDALGFPIPAVAWMDPARQADQIERETTAEAVKGTLAFLEASHGRLTFTSDAAEAAHTAIEAAVSDAGYLLPKESEGRDVSVADQVYPHKDTGKLVQRGTDDQILAIIGASAEFAKIAGDSLNNVALASATHFVNSMEAQLVNVSYRQMSEVVAATGVADAMDAVNKEIVTGKHSFDFAFITKERLEGIQSSDSDAVARRSADILASDNPEKFTELLQWVSVDAKSDVEAVARFHQALEAGNSSRNDVVVILSEGIELSRLEDIEFGRAEGLLGVNGGSMPLSKGEAELFMQLIEQVDRIVDKAYQHPQSYSDAAFPVSLASGAVDAARRIETETSARAILAGIAGGRADAIGLSREGAQALEGFLGAATDAMKAVVAQDDYVTGEAKSEEEDKGLSFGGTDGHSMEDESKVQDPLKAETGEVKIVGQTMWQGWKDRAKNGKITKHNFIAALPGALMSRLIKAHEQMGSRGAQLAVAAMAGRAGAPTLTALTVGVDPAGYASIQEAMGMGMGGRDGKTKASLMEDRAINVILTPKQEMGWADYNVLAEKTKSSINPYFMDAKVDGHAFPMTRTPKKSSEPAYMKQAWAKDLDLNGSNRADTDGEKRRIKTALVKMMKNEKGEPNREFMSFLVRLEGRQIVAPTRVAAEALREVSDAYIVSLETAREAASQRMIAQREARMADLKTTVMLDKSDALRLIQVWNAGGAMAEGFPTMVKNGDGVSIVHPNLPTVHGRLVDAKPVQSLRDGHRMAVVDVNALSQGVAKLGPVWDKIEINMVGDRIKTYGPHLLDEPKKTLNAPDQRMKQSALVI